MLSRARAAEGVTVTETNRWTIAVAGVAMQVALGAVYAWSVFRNPPGAHSAGALIDAAGLKGRRIGGAEISAMHANWILNRGGATAHDVRALHDLCVAEVQRSAGVRLESEIVFIGDAAPSGRS